MHKKTIITKIVKYEVFLDKQHFLIENHTFLQNDNHLQSRLVLISLIYKQDILAYESVSSDIHSASFDIQLVSSFTESRLLMEY
jgi:hypothetical protein